MIFSQEFLAAVLDGSVNRQVSEGNRHSLVQKRAGYASPNTNVPSHPPSPPAPVTPTSSLAATTSPVATPTIMDTASNSSSMGTAVLGIAVGGVAAFIIVPALAVLIFLYIRRWRNEGKPYKNLEGEQQDEDGHFPDGVHHYHDEIQLKDYENESRPAFKEVGTLPAPASAVHVMPAISRQASAEGKPALGSGTIRSPKS